jgi:hypothetical protein
MNISGKMKKIISASRRSDLVAFFPEWTAGVFREKSVRVFGPSGHVYTIDLKPENIHTIILWSKNFLPLLENRFGLKDVLKDFDQLYLHFTITGLGGTFIEREVIKYEDALKQINGLLNIVGHPERISIRFDPVVYWMEGDRLRTNLRLFESIAPEVSWHGIKDIRFSFAQWYGKSRKRAVKYGFHYRDPSIEEKMRDACYLSEVAAHWGLNLYSCCQKYLENLPGISPSACIDGRMLRKLHPQQEKASIKKDPSQRKDCRCTDSVDIGSYRQGCPHSCIYCYANPG